jgi:glyoxylase-like metal-dependent hydrolase (beta-lactamase superfamily II)
MRGARLRVAVRRPRIIAGLTILIAASTLVAGYRWRRAVAAPPLGRSAVTLVPGVHLLGGLDPSVAYVVETTEGLVLVDSGLDGDAGRLKSQMADLGLDWKGLRAILLTHVHGDHCGGAASLRAATGAKVYAGRGDAPVLRAGRPREAFFSTFHMPNSYPHPTPVDVELGGDETIAIGDARFRALATPGHTPGSICYLLERGDLRALFAGDVIMMLRGDDRPRSELRKPLGTYSAYLAPRYRGDARDYLASLRRLRALPVPDLVLPGHPGADPTPQSPCLSQQRWEALLDGGIRDMETLLARFERDGANFLDGQPKRLLPGLYYLGDFQGGAVYALLAASKLFLVDAPGGPGLAEFLKARLRQVGLEPSAPTAVLLTSCDPQQTAGLKELVEEGYPRVVAPAAGLEIIRESLPSGTVVLAAEDLPEQGWFPASPLPLRGRGTAPVAYRVEWAGKVVLFSGRIPIVANQESGVELFSDFIRPGGDVRDYLTSLARLRDLKPDLWLPARPSEGQNANLYDDQWDRLLEDNWNGVRKNAWLLK